MNGNPSIVKQVRRVVIFVIGGTVLVFGLALLVLPGPAFIVIPLGLAILAVEFAWARRWLHRIRDLLPRRSKPSVSREVSPPPRPAT